MQLPVEFSDKSQQMLQQLSFKLITANKSGMSEWYIWENQEMKFTIVCSIYYECSVETIKKPFEMLSLIKLLRYIKDDPDFYAKELVIANLSYTLPINDYVELFYNNYPAIKEFIVPLNEDGFKKYAQYPVSYNGL